MKRLSLILLFGMMITATPSFGDCQPDPALGPTIELSWDHADPSLVDEWRVYRSRNREPRWEFVRSMRSSCRGTDSNEEPVACGDPDELYRQYTFPGLNMLIGVAGETDLEWISHERYTLAVSAVNAAGESPLSESTVVCWPLWLQELDEQ